MKQHFGQMFLGVCIVIAALIFTHPPQRQSHHYEWLKTGELAPVPGLLDSDTGDIYICSPADKGGWFVLPPVPVRHTDKSPAFDPSKPFVRVPPPLSSKQTTNRGYEVLEPAGKVPKTFISDEATNPPPKK